MNRKLIVREFVVMTCVLAAMLAAILIPGKALDPEVAAAKAKVSTTLFGGR
jgi:hypothetical protein